MAERNLEKINAEYLQDTDSKIKDRIFNWIVMRYTERGNEFTKSDKFVWHGAVYHAPTWIGYLIFISLFLWLGNISIDKYGEARTYIFFIILIIWRLQKGISKLEDIRKKL